MARRASLSSKQADSLLKISPEAEKPKEQEASGVFDQIGDDIVTHQRVIEEVPLTRVRANPYQPRWAIDEGTVTELAHSMQQRGFFGTLTARKRGRWYELAYGHQRLAAAERAGLTTLPVEVRDLSDEEMLEYALSENMQRKDLSQLEEGEMFVRWQEELGRSERDIAERLSKSRGYIRNRIETARLPDDLKQVLREQVNRPAVDTADINLPPRFELSPAAAKELARIEDTVQRQRLLDEVISRQLSYKQTKSLVDSALRPARPGTTYREEKPDKEHLFGNIMSRLEEEARRVKPTERQEALRALNELIARAEQIKETLEKMR